MEIKIIENFKFKEPFNLTTSGDVSQQAIDIAKERAIYRKSWIKNTYEFNKERGELIINYEESGK